MRLQGSSQQARMVLGRSVTIATSLDMSGETVQKKTSQQVLEIDRLARMTILQYGVGRHQGWVIQSKESTMLER